MYHPASSPAPLLPNIVSPVINVLVYGTFVTIEEQYWYIFINSVYSLFKFPYFFLLQKLR